MVAPSLCPGWTVQDVVAHLTLVTRETRWELVKGVVKARGNFDRMNTDSARAHARRFAARPPSSTNSGRPPRRTRRAPLQQPARSAHRRARPRAGRRPTDRRTHPMAPEHAVPALDHAMHSRWYGGSKRFDDVTLVATDADWSAGTGGDKVRGAAGDLLLVATGRPGGPPGALRTRHRIHASSAS